MKSFRARRNFSHLLYPRSLYFFETPAVANIYMAFLVISDKGKFVNFVENHHIFLNIQLKVVCLLLIVIGDLQGVAIAFRSPPRIILNPFSIYSLDISSMVRESIASFQLESSRILDRLSPHIFKYPVLNPC